MSWEIRLYRNVCSTAFVMYTMCVCMSGIRQVSELVSVCMYLFILMLAVREVLFTARVNYYEGKK